MTEPVAYNDGWTPYGFDWGPMTVTRMAHIEGRGYALGIVVGRRRFQVWVSEKGRSVRFFDGNTEWAAADIEDFDAAVSRVRKWLAVRNGEVTMLEVPSLLRAAVGET